jgi:methylthioribose-1-phosphate isomerase
VLQQQKDARTIKKSPFLYLFSQKIVPPAQTTGLMHKKSLRYLVAAGTFSRTVFLYIPMFIQPVPTLRRDGDSIIILDQTALPWHREERRLATLGEVATAIVTMQVRGAPLIGCTAACGLAVALTADGADDAALDHALTILRATRPTAVNLVWALRRMEKQLRPLPEAARRAAAWQEAAAICSEDAATCAAIGAHGLDLLRALPARVGRALRVMTHCNAGWLATLGAGTALAPIYAAQTAGMAIEVYVSETRPRNQGLLTEWELAAAGVAHILIADNAAGLLLARGEVDAVIVGADRIAANGDTANKIGTYLKALAAREAGVPFYVAAPFSTFDINTPDGEAITIEERARAEVLTLTGRDAEGREQTLQLAPPTTRAVNPAFDITPAKLIAGFITERGIVPAEAVGDMLRGATT